MNQRTFDQWSRILATESLSRRGGLKLAAGGALASLLAGAGLSGRVAEAASCLRVDRPCRQARQCCSGICRGKKGKQTCRGHGAGTCKRGQSFCTSPDPELLTCNNQADCYCLLTTSGTSFCYGGAGSGSECTDCERDADCVKLGFPRGSACVPSTAGRCAGNCEGGTACAVRCGTVIPPPE